MYGEETDEQQQNFMTEMDSFVEIELY